MKDNMSGKDINENMETSIAEVVESSKSPSVKFELKEPRDKRVMTQIKKEGQQNTDFLSFNKPENQDDEESIIMIRGNDEQNLEFSSKMEEKKEIDMESEGTQMGRGL